MAQKQYTREEILQGSKIGIEFEFLTNMDPVDTARSLSDAIEKRVLVPLNVDEFTKSEGKLKYHTPIDLVGMPWMCKLESDYSCGKKGNELITAPLPYQDARNTILRVCKWIKQHGWTTDRCSMHLNISFDDNYVKTKTEIRHINVLKFCLDFDENKVYAEFPNRKDSIYANSIKKLITNNIFNTTITTNSQLITPNEKYYGVNFTKAFKDYLEFRYLGCKDYENKVTTIIDMMDYFIEFTFNILQNPEVTEKENKELQVTLENYKKVLEVYRNPMLLKSNFPKLQIMVDTQEDSKIIKTFWGTIKDKVLEALLKCNIHEGIINYDSDISELQLKDCVLKFGTIEDVTLIGCSGNGFVKNCKIFDCNFEDVNFTDCWFFTGSKVKDSQLKNCIVKPSNEFNNCYIQNEKQFLFAGIMNGGVFRKGPISKDAEISSSTDIIEHKVVTANPNVKKFGIYVSPDKGTFQNKKLFVTKGK